MALADVEINKQIFISFLTFCLPLLKTTNIKFNRNPLTNFIN